MNEDYPLNWTDAGIMAGGSIMPAKGSILSKKRMGAIWNAASERDIGNIVNNIEVPESNTLITKDFFKYFADYYFFSIWYANTDPIAPITIDGITLDDLSNHACLNADLMDKLVESLNECQMAFIDENLYSVLTRIFNCGSQQYSGTYQNNPYDTDFALDRFEANFSRTPRVSISNYFSGWGISWQYKSASNPSLGGSWYEFDPSWTGSGGVLPPITWHNCDQGNYTLRGYTVSDYLLDINEGGQLAPQCQLLINVRFDAWGGYVSYTDPLLPYFTATAKTILTSNRISEFDLRFNPSTQDLTFQQKSPPTYHEYQLIGTNPLWVALKIVDRKLYLNGYEFLFTSTPPAP